MSARATENAQASPDPEGAELDGETEVVDPFEDDDEQDDLAGDLEEADALDDELEPGDDADTGSDLDQLAADDDSDDEEDEAPAVTVVPPDAEFDDDAPVAAVGDDDADDDEEIEGLRAGEFVCRGCFMAKRDTQLADADALLCRDCA